MILTKSRNTWPVLWWCSDCRNRVSKIAYLFCNMTNECFAILVSAPDFIEEGPLLHCTHCTKKLKKVSYVAYPHKMRLNIHLLNIYSKVHFSDLLKDSNTRPVVPGCAGCAMAHPNFGRSVNPISTRGDRLCPPK